MTADSPVVGRRTFMTIMSGIAVGAGTGVAGGREQVDDLPRQLEGVRAATRGYRDVETARSHGYEPLLGYFPGMGFHFTDRNPPFGTDRTDPPLLVYFTDGSYDPEPGALHDSDHDDRLVLGGVEYLVPGDREAAPPDVFADEASPRALKVSESSGWHFEADLGVTGLHAWVHRANPAGVFHPTNPTID